MSSAKLMVFAVKKIRSAHRRHIPLKSSSGNRAATEDLPPFSIKAEGQSAESKERSVPIYARVTDANERAAAEAMNHVFDRLQRTKDAV